jgi:hypothetical protein
LYFNIKNSKNKCIDVLINISILAIYLLNKILAKVTFLYAKIASNFTVQINDCRVKIGVDITN